MTFAKLSLAALLLGTSFAPAFAEEADSAAAPLAAFQQSIGLRAASPAAAPVVEGRQAAPIAAQAHETASEHYLDGRISDIDR